MARIVMTVPQKTELAKQQALLWQERCRQPYRRGTRIANVPSQQCYPTQYVLAWPSPGQRRCSTFGSGDGG